MITIKTVTGVEYTLTESEEETYNLFLEIGDDNIASQYLADLIN